MLTQKPKTKLKAVRIKVQEFDGSDYMPSQNGCVTLYDTTASEVMAMIRRAIERDAPVIRLGKSPLKKNGAK